MKKFVAFIIAVLYFTASSGVVLNVHYCMGKVSSVEVDNFAGNSCKCGKKQTKSKCCSSEFKVVKLNSDYKATTSTSNINLPVAVLPAKISFINTSEINSEVVLAPVANAPPNGYEKIYIKNCVFRV